MGSGIQKQFLPKLPCARKLHAKPVAYPTFTRHIWQEYLERVGDVQLSLVDKATRTLRLQTFERVFAYAKEKHVMRYT